MAASVLSRKIRVQQVVIWAANLLDSLVRLIPFFLGIVLLYGASALFLVHTPGTARSLDALLLVIVLLALLFRVLQLRRRAGNLVQVAWQLEQKTPALRSDLSNALQFSGHGTPEGSSECLTRLAVARGCAAAASLRWKDSLPDIVLSKPKRIAGLALAIAVLALVCVSPLSRRSVIGLLQPSRLAANTVPLHVAPGNAVVVWGDSLVITVVDRHGEVLDWQVSDPDLMRAVFHYRSHDTASLMLPQVRKPFSYSVRSLRRASPEYNVQVRARPRIEELRITLRYPSYIGQTPKALAPDLGDFSAPLGTRVDLELRANKALRTGDILILPGSRAVSMAVNGRTVRGSFRVDANLEYEVAVRDIDSLAGDDAIRYRVGVIGDQPPAVALARPGEDLVLDRSLQVALAAVVEDDYGLSAIRLHYRIQSEDGLAPEDSIALPLRRLGRRIDTVETAWDLRRISIYPGDEIQFWVKAWDNDAIHGAKPGQSVVRKARFPSTREIYAQAQKEEEMLAADLQSARQAQERLQKETESLQQKMQTKAPGPKETARMDRLQEDQLELAQSIDSLAQRIADQVATQLSDESVRSSVEQRMGELRKQVDALRNSRFAELFEKMGTMPAQPDLARLRQMLEQTAREQQDLLSQLDQTLEYLRQLQAQNRIQDLAEQLSQMADQQDSLLKETGRNPANAQSAANRQERLAQNLEALQKTMQSAQSDSALEATMKEGLDALRRQLDEDSASGQMRNAAGKLSQGQLSAAMAGQRRAAASLRKASSRMMALAAKARGRSMDKLISELRALSSQLLLVSFDAESLATGKRQPEPGILADELEAATSQLVDLGQTLGFSDPVVMRHLSNALTQCRVLADGRSGSPWAVVEATNRAILRLQKQASALSTMSAKAGMSMNKMMAGLMAMSSEQMMLNQMLRQMLEGAMRGGTKPSRGESGRLASSQRSLMERYEQLRREIQNRPDRPFDPPNVRQNMEEIVRDIESGNANSETLRKQETILSRMLDGSLSLQQRDFSKRRLAEIEHRNLQRSAPPPLVPEELRKLKAAGTRYADYPPEYHDRIREYLRSN